MGQPAFRGGQVFRWLHAARAMPGRGEGELYRAQSFAEMTDLPTALRQRLAEEYTIAWPTVAECQQAADGTQKLLMQLADENRVETVLMRYAHGDSVCVSSQVGCRMGCRFCASTILRNLDAGEMAGHEVPSVACEANTRARCAAKGDGPEPQSPHSGRTAGADKKYQQTFLRNLDAGEMAGQVYAAQLLGGRRAGHVVLMGIGEPLDNYDNVMDFISILTDKDGQDQAGRNISLSTCGVVPGIRRLAKEQLSLTLSVSLHAPTDEIRSRLMPVNDAWPLAELMAACRDYYAATKRRISYEYALFRGVNDGPKQAKQLAALLAGQNAHLNLIAANPVPNSPFAASDDATVAQFARLMQAAGAQTTVRRRLGSDIDAACGQLRLNREAPPKQDTAP